mgnify:CR=1 FL=1
MREFGFLRIDTDAEECSHFEQSDIAMNSSDYARPAPPLGTSEPGAAEKYVFLELPVGWVGDWHPTPVRQWLILMSGECEFETGDGDRRRIKAGEVVMLDDLVGKGHQTRVLGDIPVRIAAIHLP